MGNHHGRCAVCSTSTWSPTNTVPIVVTVGDETVIGTVVLCYRHQKPKSIELHKLLTRTWHKRSVKPGVAAD